MHLSTTLPALPRGTTAVDVSFPGLPTFDDVPVTTAPDAAVRVRPPVPRDTGTWTYEEAEPPRGWTTAEWPTPVPAAAQVRDYQSRTERLLDRLP